MTGRLRVLIVDDHPGVLKGVSRLLSCSHDVVGSIADGRELLEAVQRLSPDIVVLDVNLPGIGGIELCSQITRSHPDLKVIVFTAADEPEVRRRAFAAGASAFVSKLAFDGSLLSTIERIGAGQA